MAKSKKHIYESIIIGSGIAGIAASIYASRKRMDYLFLGKEYGGQINVAGEIENYPGFKKTNWTEFGNALKEQLAYNKIKITEEVVKSIKKSTKKNFIVKTNKNEYETQTVLITTGAKARKLNVPGEKEFANKGVTYCAICDGPLFKGKDVVVVGGGASALEAADFLMRIANRIYMINIAPKLTGHEYLVERIAGKDKVTVINNAKVTEILGDKFVKGLKYEEKGIKKELKIQGVFVEIGRVPDTDFVKGFVKLDKEGHIMVDKANQTNVTGVYAAGDCSDIHEYQFVISAGQAVVALLKAARYLAGKK